MQSSDLYLNKHKLIDYDNKITPFIDFDKQDQIIDNQENLMK